ncbi:MAG: DUF4124 domain-containing protein [bacterium]
MFKWFFMVMLFLAVSAQATTVYKWVDENGQVHFGERPPQGETFDTLEYDDKVPQKKPAKPTEDDSNAEEGGAKAEQVDDRVVQDAVARREALKQKVKMENCSISKKNLKTLYQNKSVSLSKDGKSTKAIGPEARKAEIERMKKQIKTYCE